MNAEGTLIWTVSIKDRLEPEMDIWTATFSTEKKADDFIEKAKEKLRSYLDDEMYLSWIDARWDEEGE